MKKVLVVFLVLASMVSCKKITDEDRLAKVGQCYTCTYGVSNGYQRTPDTYCGPMPYMAKDAQGNDIQTYCVPK